MTIPICEPPDFQPRSPRTQLPAHAIDTHFHVFGPASRYPLAPGRTYTPSDAGLDAYEELASVLGFDRAVIVQPSVYGVDNRRTLSVLDQTTLPMRAVVVIDADITDAELDSLNKRGVRGARINLVFNPGESFALATRLADRIRDIGWHLQFLVDVSTIEDLALRVKALRIPVVFDHLGHVPTSKGICNAGFRDLLKLVTEGIGWAKLCGSYRFTRERGLPPYSDVFPFAEALISANPERVIWGTDWPHPSIPVPMPNDGDLTEMVLRWATDEALRRRIFVTNAETLYGFPPAAPLAKSEW
ncbi:amidohydrolase family protein [Dongia sp.]|uniref:amidohydrolase family protein n=1 Tax=Dongia sp. TaxID=1977262 RepID=UPI0035B431B2